MICDVYVLKYSKTTEQLLYIFLTDNILQQQNILSQDNRAQKLPVCSLPNISGF